MLLLLIGQERICVREKPRKQPAFMLYTALLSRYKLRVVQAEHTAGSSNIMKPIDALSREKKTRLNIQRYVHLEEVALVGEIMAVCNPTTEFNCLGYHEVYIFIHDWLDRFQQVCGQKI